MIRIKDETPPKPKKPTKAASTPPKPSKGGRPRLEDVANTIEAQKPWLTHDPPMSRRTWYRRREEMRKEMEK